MKIVGVVAAVALGATGAAQAQTAACNQMKLLLTTKVDQVKGFAGAETKRTGDKITYTSTTNPTGFGGCTFEHAIDQSKNFSGYQDYNVSCSNEFADSEAAFKYLDDLKACVWDFVGERKAIEIYMGGRYRMHELDARYGQTGRDVKFEFGKTEYVRLWVRKAYPDSAKVHLNLFYSFQR